jgi:hypothetical protein
MFCKAPIVTWRRVDSDLKANPVVLFGARAATEPVPKEVAKTTDVQCTEGGLSQDNDFLTPKGSGVFFIKTASKQPLFKAR